MHSQFPRLFRVTTSRNLSISTILGNDTSLSWDLYFCRNLIDVEIEDIKRLMTLFSHVHLSPFILDAKTWVIFSSEVFLVKSFFLTLSKFSDSVPFYLTILFLFILFIFYFYFLWKLRVPSKIRTFAWLVTHKKVNTNDML